MCIFEMFLYIIPQLLLSNKLLCDNILIVDTRYQFFQFKTNKHNTQDITCNTYYSKIF